jgi:hypothetical protein
MGIREKRRGEGTKGIEYPLNLLLLLLLTFYVGGIMGRRIVAKGDFFWWNMMGIYRGGEGGSRRGLGGWLGCV